MRRRAPAITRRVRRPERRAGDEGLQEGFVGRLGEEVDAVQPYLFRDTAHRRPMEGTANVEHVRNELIAALTRPPCNGACGACRGRYAERKRPSAPLRHPAAMEKGIGFLRNDMRRRGSLLQ